MTVNERLFYAELVEDHDAAVASGDLSKINEVLRKVDLRQDDSEMNWSINAED